MLSSSIRCCCQLVILLTSSASHADLVNAGWYWPTPGSSIQNTSGSANNSSISKSNYQISPEKPEMVQVTPTGISGEVYFPTNDPHGVNGPGHRQGPSSSESTISSNTTTSVKKPFSFDFLIIGDWGRPRESKLNSKMKLSRSKPMPKCEETIEFLCTMNDADSKDAKPKFVISTGDNFYKGKTMLMYEGVESADDPKFNVSRKNPLRFIHHPLIYTFRLLS